MEKKRLAQLFLALFIGIIFISSYVSLVNYNSQQQARTTVPQTVYAQALANGIIIGYGNPMHLSVSGQNASARSTASNIIDSNLTKLEENGSVLDFYAAGDNVTVASQNSSSYQVYSFIVARLGPSLSGTLSANATAYVELPQEMNFTIGTQKARLPIPPSYLNQSMVLPLWYGIGRQIRVKASALVTANGTIYGQMSVVPI